MRSWYMVQVGQYKDASEYCETLFSQCLSPSDSASLRVIIASCKLHLGEVWNSYMEILRARGLEQQLRNQKTQ